MFSWGDKSLAARCDRRVRTILQPPSPGSQHLAYALFTSLPHCGSVRWFEHIIISWWCYLYSDSAPGHCALRQRPVSNLS